MRNHFYRFARELPTELQPWEFHIYRPVLKLPRIRYQRKFGGPGNPIDLGEAFSNPAYLRAVLNDMMEAIKAEKENERRRQKEWEDE